MRTITRWLALLGGDGLREAARGIAGEGAEALAERLELATLEWREWRRRSLLLIVGGLLLMVFVLLTLFIGSLAVMVQFWDSGYRLHAVWGVAGFWLLASLVLAIVLVQTARRAPAAFALSREELARDWALAKESM